MLLASAIISGLGPGIMYGLIALGFHITCAVSNTVNFAQSSALMLGAVLGYTFGVAFGWPMPVAILAALTVCGLLPEVTSELFDVLADLRDEGIAILLVDQMAASRLAVADRGYVLASGYIVQADEASVLAGNSELEVAYLGHAQTMERAVS